MNRDEVSNIYGISNWGKGLFEVGDHGELQVLLAGKKVSLKGVCDDLEARGLTAPLLIRFSDILQDRMRRIHGAFALAREEADYQGNYFGVYPIKVNQQSQVVEEVVEFGKAFQWGLEAGSKPELHAVLAMMEDIDGPIICNGYKDREFIYLALIGQKLGKQVFIVVEKMSELSIIIELSRQLQVTPLIGLRCRLATASEGKWKASGGEASKFGLSTEEILQAVETLKQEAMLHCLSLLHFHLGSQIPHIRHIKQALQEVGRFYVELRRLNAPIDYIDVGGGLGVDYDGSLSGSESSVDYSVDEYASNIVWELKAICDEESLPQPHIISESGRSLVAHHAVLIIDVLGTNQRANGAAVVMPDEHAPLPLRQLWETLEELNPKEARMLYHDAVAYREDMQRLFVLGHCRLEERALADSIYQNIMRQLQVWAQTDEALAEEMKESLALLRDKYFCNFSIFQSLPDAWAINQVFPVTPIHRLDEMPDRLGYLVDVSCDSDGRLSHFPCAGEVTNSLPLHPVREDEDYLLGIFLVGAYQEILGDLHNLFGDTHAIHIRMDGDTLEIEQIVEGESVAEVLEYVQFDEKVLLDRVRREFAKARTEGRVTASEANAYLRFYKEGLAGYTYLEDHLPPSVTPR
ncbi:MAG: biosynthetic arginine decarboxylase [Zetaproteobacteria bacterium]|nr:biosynthetic arginine decarboxylase [Zetaproteobacteria bacterium]